MIFTLADYKPKTCAWVIQRYIEDKAQPDMAPLGASHLYTLQVIQRAWPGAKLATELTKGDIIQFMRELKAGKYSRKDVLNKATVNQYFNYWCGAFKHVASAYDDCDFIKIEPFIAARLFLARNLIVGKADERTRRPTDAEIITLLDYYAKPNERGKRRQIRMAEIIAFALVSARRLGEICRITWGDVDFAAKTYKVRDCKHPTKKKGNDKTFVLWPELAEIIRRQPRLTHDPIERIFPFNAKSVSASYQIAKKRTNIEGLRFHDNRAEAISKWLKKMPVEDVCDLVSGHDEVKTCRDHYDRRETMEIALDKYPALLQ